MNELVAGKVTSMFGFPAASTNATTSRVRGGVVNVPTSVERFGGYAGSKPGGRWDQASVRCWATGQRVHIRSASSTVNDIGIWSLHPAHSESHCFRFQDYFQRPSRLRQNGHHLGLGPMLWTLMPWSLTSIVQFPKAGEETTVTCW